MRGTSQQIWCSSVYDVGCGHASASPARAATAEASERASGTAAGELASLGSDDSLECGPWLTARVCSRSSLICAPPHAVSCDASPTSNTRTPSGARPDAASPRADSARSNRRRPRQSLRCRSATPRRALADSASVARGQRQRNASAPQAHRREAAQTVAAQRVERLALQPLPMRRATRVTHDSATLAGAHLGNAGVGGLLDRLVALAFRARRLGARLGRRRLGLDVWFVILFIIVILLLRLVIIIFVLCRER